MIDPNGPRPRESPIDAARYQRIRAIVHAAADVPAPERAAFVDRACADDDALRRDVRALLDEDVPDTAEIGAPVDALAAELSSESTADTPTGEPSTRRWPLRTGALAAVAATIALVVWASSSTPDRDSPRPAAPTRPTDRPESTKLAATLNRASRLFLDLDDPTTASIVLRASIRARDASTPEPRLAAEMLAWAERAERAMGAREDLPSAMRQRMNHAVAELRATARASAR